MSNESKVQLFEDVWNTVYDDSYMWLVIWGPPRTSKTTIAGWILYSLYKDWNKVLEATVFNLPQLLFKLKNGQPERWPTKNMLHMRVPALNWDDFGAYSNKAVTQRDEAWDHFKGGFDVLGTKIGVLVATMVDPLEPTFQIQSKYTHEIEVKSKGRYKYDKVEWQQDFHGWKTRTKKTFIEENTYDPWPDWVYKKYDETRMELADEVFQRIEDSLTTTHLGTVLKLCKPIDFELLKLIDERGQIHQHVVEQYGKEGKSAVLRLKSRSLIVPARQGDSTYYKYDLTPLGKEALEKYVEANSSKPSESST